MNMRHVLLLFVFLFFHLAQSQTNERFIRIIGNAKKELSANKAKVVLTISERKANQYVNDSLAMSFNEAYRNAISKLSKIGIKESDLKLSIQNRYNNRQISKRYSLTIDYEKLQNLSELQDNSMKMSDIAYLFELIDENLETELSLKAIEDAKRKAKAICDEIGMEVGDILNIEVKEAGFGTELIADKKDTLTKSFKVTITFKLID